MNPTITEISKKINKLTVYEIGYVLEIIENKLKTFVN